MNDPQPRLKFPASSRVKHRNDFNRVFEKGRVFSDSVLVVHVLPRSGEGTRLGISVSKKVGCSPVRNRWKRLIREAFRLNQVNLPAGLDIVARPRKGAAPEFHRIEVSLRRLCQRAGR